MVLLKNLLLLGQMQTLPKDLHISMYARELLGIVVERVGRLNTTSAQKKYENTVECFIFYSSPILTPYFPSVLVQLS